MQGSIQRIHALQWVNGDSDAARIPSAGLSQKHYKPYQHQLLPREGEQTHLFDKAANFATAGSGQMPGAVAAAPQCFVQGFCTVVPQFPLSLELCTVIQV